MEVGARVDLARLERGLNSRHYPEGKRPDEDDGPNEWDEVLS